MPKTILTLDSSQLSQHFDCPTSWDLGSQQNLIQINKFDPSATLRPSDAIASGTLGHKMLELYYTELATSQDPVSAVEKMFAFNPDLADNAEEQFPLSPDVRLKVKNALRNYILTYPAHLDFKPARRRTPQISVNKDGFLQDTWKYEPLIEKGFSYNLYESTTELFVLEGRIDFIGESQDGTMLWMDHKFQLREHLLYSKSIQFRNYSLALGLNIAVVNYVRLHDKPGPKTFCRQPISFSGYEMRCWKDELRDIFRTIAKEVSADAYPQNRLSCQGRYGSPCQFTPLCEEYNPETKRAIQKRDYTTKKEWRPW